MKRDLTSSTSTDWPSNALPQHWIESLFERMLFAYGKKFSDQWGGAEATGLKRYWAEHLADLLPEELKRGVAALEGRDWPPTLPEFKKLCRPGADPMVAYYEAVNGVVSRERGEKGEWSHPAIFWAAASMAHDLKNQTFSHNKPHWEKALREQMERGEWEPIPEPMLALPEPGKSKTSKEQAAKLLEQYHAGEIIKGPKSDHKRWIRKVLERQEQGDQHLPDISVRMAHEAMNQAKRD